MIWYSTKTRLFLTESTFWTSIDVILFRYVKFMLQEHNRQQIIDDDKLYVERPLARWDDKNSIFIRLTLVDVGRRDNNETRERRVKGQACNQLRTQITNDCTAWSSNDNDDWKDGIRYYYI